MTRTISLATSKGRGANIAPKTLTVRSKRVVIDAAQVGRGALLEPAVGQPQGHGPPVACLDEVGSDVDAQYVRAALCGGHCRGPVTAAQVEDLQVSR